MGMWRATISVAAVLVGLAGCASQGSKAPASISSTDQAAPSASVEADAAKAAPPSLGAYEQAVQTATDPLSPTRLILNSRYGQDKVVSYLLQNKVDVNARDKFGATALMGAAEGGHESVVIMLVKSGADVNAKTQEGLTALMAAASSGSVPILKVLLQSGAQIGAVDNIGETALFYAVKLGNIGVTQALLEAGADPNIQNRNRVNASNSGYSPLMYAADHGNNATSSDWAAMTKLLLNKGASPNVRSNHGDTALSIATRRQDRAVLALLDSAGAREERSYTSLTDEAAFIKAARVGDIEKLTYLLSTGMKPDVQNDGGVTPLLAATYEGHLSAVEKLVKAGAKINLVTTGLREWAFNASRASITDRDLLEAASRGDTALLLAIRRGHDKLVEFLLQSGATPSQANNRGESPIFAAAAEGHAEAVRMLLARGVDANILETEKLTVSMSHQLQTMGRNTPIIAAAQGGHADAVDVLIKGGADVNHVGFLNKTALLWASDRDYPAVVDRLLKAKANPNLNDVEGMTPLLVAARNGNARMVSALLNAKADPNKMQLSDYPGGGGKAFGSQGMTPLIYAARGGHQDIVKMLLDARADVNAMTQTGETAIKEAKGNGFQKIIEMLRVSGAQ